jgi:hypothetical protein
MTWDVLEKFLRWVFWGLAYLMVLVTALVLVVGKTTLPEPLKWAIFGVFVWGVCLDAARKRKPEKTKA